MYHYSRNKKATPQNEKPKGMRYMDKSIFKRHELKYLVSAEQRELIESAFERYMVPDEHGESTI